MSSYEKFLSALATLTPNRKLAKVAEPGLRLEAEEARAKADLLLEEISSVTDWEEYENLYYRGVHQAVEEAERAERLWRDIQRILR